MSENDFSSDDQLPFPIKKVTRENIDDMLARPFNRRADGLTPLQQWELMSLCLSPDDSRLDLVQIELETMEGGGSFRLKCSECHQYFTVTANSWGKCDCALPN